MEGLKQLPILHDFIKKAKKLGYEFVKLEEGKYVPNIKNVKFIMDITR